MCIMYNRFVSELKLYMHLRHEAEAVIAYGGNIVLCDNFVTNISRSSVNRSADMYASITFVILVYTQYKGIRDSQVGKVGS
jgi:hypothetical protein